MKSKIEVRTFAVNKAVEILGHGTPDKDVISKAKEIEAYIIGEAELPETYNEMVEANGILGGILNAIGNNIPDYGNMPSTDVETPATDEETASADGKAKKTK